MRILLPTGRVTEELVKKSASGFDADVVVTGELASFLTPGQLLSILKSSTKAYDLVLVSGMCTASFKEAEKEIGVPVYRGPRHAADLALVLPLLETLVLSRDVPADEFLAEKRKDEAYSRICRQEEESEYSFKIHVIKIGKKTRIKVLQR